MNKMFYFNGHRDSQSNLIVESVTTTQLPTTVATLSFDNEVFVGGAKFEPFPMCLAVRPALNFSGFGEAGFEPVTSFIADDHQEWALRFNSSGVLELWSISNESTIFRATKVIGPKDTTLLKMHIDSSANAFLFSWGGTYYYTDMATYPNNVKSVKSTSPYDVYTILKPITSTSPQYIAVSWLISGSETDSGNLLLPVITWQDTVDDYDFIHNDKLSAALASIPFVNR